MLDSDGQKRSAAEAGVDRIASGMVVGLGTGSTARFAIERLGAKVREGLLRDIVCVSTSEDTARRARAVGLSLSNLEAHPVLDLALDGADEFAPNLDVLKGLGGAMLREKEVARAARRFIVFVDESKRVRRLGERAPLPVEVRPEYASHLATWLRTLGSVPKLRGDGGYHTDNGNLILDCLFEGGIPDPGALAEKLEAEPRVLAHGLFLGMTTEILIGTPKGVEVLSPQGAE